MDSLIQTICTITMSVRGEHRWAVCEVWVDRWAGLRVGFININDKYNTDVGKGGVYAYEAYEAK